MGWAAFYCGLVAGGCLGALVMSLLVMARDPEPPPEEQAWKNKTP